MDVESAAEELYGLPPAEFTAARDRLAARARAAGDRELAARIRALRRPTLAAWASNLLVRTRPDRARSLLAPGGGPRPARTAPGGARPDEPESRHHARVAALAREAQRLAAEAGREIGDAARGQVEATLRAALADPEAARQWLSGRLSRALGAPAGRGTTGTAGSGGPGRPRPSPRVPGGAGESSAGAGAPGPCAAPAGRRGGPRAGDGDGPLHPDAALRVPRERAGEEVVAARREAAARESEARRARDALEGAEQRAHETDLQVEEVVVRLREAQARREAAHRAADEAGRRVREAERAARRAARHVREVAGRPDRGGRDDGGGGT
ncbi:hypothetical protein LUW75_00785 [Streptomyces sp. MRC013]|uniref:hypothetical protein n=1 Tax=Streptomyces sp. MRC013 TaxID=2898276 RepID=UPI002025BA9D|nr:hypothetical protein [Streptomyces sp. MRC013]URM92839.1 hypothetical protein LUW75_00785 [Streptomyces sp. MRC013]